MFRFEHPEWLWLLLLLPLIWLSFGFYLRWQKKKREAFANPSLHKGIMPDFSAGRSLLKFGLYSSGLGFLILALANPQLGTRVEKVKREGIDVVIALDVSRSMLAEDVKPNRLLRAKNFIAQFIERLSDDRLGFVVFAGRAYLQMPLTVDYAAGKMYLKSMSPRLVPTQGTALGEAIAQARKAFVQGEQKHKALVIITDGEDNEAGALEEARAAAAEGIRIFTVGVGSEKGSPIPVSAGGGGVSDFKRDESNNIVLSRMNPEALKELADAGKGKFVPLMSGAPEAEAILRELGKLETKGFEEMVFTDYDHRFQYMLGLAILALIIDFLIQESRQTWYKNLWKRN
jgi:Ca-activated chloride channel family protein